MVTRSEVVAVRVLDSEVKLLTTMDGNSNKLLPSMPFQTQLQAVEQAMYGDDPQSLMQQDQHVQGFSFMHELGMAQHDVDGGGLEEAMGMVDDPEGFNMSWHTATGSMTRLLPLKGTLLTVLSIPRLENLIKYQ